MIAGLLLGYFETGITGLVSGFILGRSILTIAYPLMVGRLLETPLKSQLRGLWRPAAYTAVSFAAAIWLSDLLRASRWGTALGWIGFVLSAGLTGGVAVLLAFYLGLPRHLSHVSGASMLGCRLPVPPLLEPLYERYYCWKYGATEGGSIHLDNLCPYLLELYHILAEERRMPLQQVFHGSQRPR